MTLDPPCRELLQAIGAYLDVTPKPTSTEQVVDWWKEVADRAAVVRVAIDTVLAHTTHQQRQAQRLAAELRRLTAEGGAPADPPLITRPHDWPRGGDRPTP